MDKELQDLKSVLRSLVVSSPAQMDVRTLACDYRNMMGAPIPLAKYGYRDILTFLRERCGDCFLGHSSNPVLTLIVPDSLKHIDQFVQRQKCSSITKMKGKRRSVETPIKPPEKPTFESNRICETFAKKHATKQSLIYQPPQLRSNYNPPEVKSNYYTPEVKSNYHPPNVKLNYHPPDVKSKDYPPNVKSNYRPTEVKSNKYRPSEVKPNYHPPNVKSNYHPPNVKSNYCPTEVKSDKYQSSEVKSNYHPPDVKTKDCPPEVQLNYHPPEVKPTGIETEQLPESSNLLANNKYNGTEEVMSSVKPVQNSVQKKCQWIYDSSCHLDREDCSETDKVSIKDDNDSGRQTLSSQSSTKKAQLDELKCEVYELIKEHENGILCTNILRLYRERYSRELDLSRFHHHNINSLLSSMDDCVSFVQEADGVRVRDARAQSPPPPPRPRPRPVLASLPLSRSMLALPVDPEDALPGIAYEADVFPADCMQFMDSIPALSLDDICTGAMLEVAVGEVYSPSLFWLQLIGPSYSYAMDDMMDAMSEYYNSNAGRERYLARGAVRPGQYCASQYDGDWHRSTIVRIVDADTVKVRHVDYGTVDSVPVSSLKPLLRLWGTLPAQGLRARLAGLRPGASGRRWPHAAAAHFLHLVRDRHFVANVVAVNLEEESIETFLIDTSGADDVCLTAEMIRAGHADERCDSALGSGDSYLYPRFEALESGATPNYGDIHRYLADGISLEYVAEYRRHVPPTPPAAPPATTPAAPPATTPAAPPAAHTAAPPAAHTAAPPAARDTCASAASASSDPTVSSPADYPTPAPVTVAAPTTVPVSTLTPPAPGQGASATQHSTGAAPGVAGVQLSTNDYEMYMDLQRRTLALWYRFGTVCPVAAAVVPRVPSPLQFGFNTTSPFTLNPQAAEFHVRFPLTAGSVRPPPGFESSPPGYVPRMPAFAPPPPPSHVLPSSPQPPPAC